MLTFVVTFILGSDILIFMCSLYKVFKMNAQQEGNACPHVSFLKLLNVFQ
jgi:hypothetical protein